MPSSANPTPLARRTRLATAVTASALALGLLIPTAAHAQTPAEAPAGSDPASAGQALLEAMGAPDATSADGAVWAPEASGFASTPSADLPAGTTGGAAGETVVVDDLAELTEAAAAEEPLTVLVKGTITVGDGDMITVGADKTIAGAASGGEIVDGGLFVDKTENIIIRNLTFRDSFMAGDWDGKLPENDNDGIRIDTADHVWVDHNEFERLGDGQLDIRKDSTNVTASWNYFHDHDKTLGVGWTKNVETTLTLHHNRFDNVHQRNASLDNVKQAHVYNNWLSGLSSYGMNARGGTSALIESNVFEEGRNVLIADDSATLDARDNEFSDLYHSAPAQSTGTVTVDAYDYGVDETSNVEDLLTSYVGTTKTPKKEKLDDTVTVAQDGSGDFLSVDAAVGAASRVDHPVEIIVEPGEYREIVSVWSGAEGLTLRGATGNPDDVVITYDKPEIDWANTPPMTVFASDVTLADLTLSNTYDGSAGESAAYAFADSGQGTVLDDVVVLGDTTHEGPR